MPSPFPGMDPYLESPDGFPDLHGDPMTHMKGALQRSLPLPQIAIPLLPGDPDMPLDFQGIFDRIYEEGPYSREIEYGKDRIVPRLKPEQAAWAADLFKQRRRRK